MIKKLTLLTTFCLLGCWALAQNLNVSVATTPSCSLSGTATATVTNGTPPYTYTWYIGSFGTISPVTTNQLTNLGGGYVSVMATDANGQTGWGGNPVQPPFNIVGTTTPDSCSGNTGTASVTINGGTSPYTYLWSNGATVPNLTNLASGGYQLTVTDAAGCMHTTDPDSGGIYVSPWSPMNATSSSTPSSCNDGTATATATLGTAPYTYYWTSYQDPNFPVQTTQTATNLPVGSYKCTITDAVGCFIERFVFVQQGTPPFSVNVNKVDESCLTGNGSITLVVSGGVGPYTYLWSNGATTPSISNLSSASYSVVITDANGCPLTKNVFVGRTSPISLSISGVDPSCGMTNGSASVTASNGTAPYTYDWYNGATTATTTGLDEGWQHVTVTDAQGCVETANIYLEYPISCYGVISGTVYQDNAGNCLPGTNPGMPNVFVNNGSSWDKTNGAGAYNFLELPGTYTLSQNSVPIYHNQLCPAAPGTLSATVSGPGSVSSGNDFFNEPILPVQDLRVSMYCHFARPGFQHRVTLVAYNDGTVPTNADLTFVHDAGVSYSSAIPAATNYNSTNQTATWNFGSIPANGSRSVQIYLDVPTAAVLGTVLNHSSLLNPTANDSTPNNNAYSCQRTITGSFDPNDKQVFPSGDIQNDQLLEYMIRFQNTGTDTAFTVMISDSISGLLDLGTFVEGASSHDYTLDLKGNGILEWTFDNILLPDSNTNEPASHGYVTFYIKPKPNLNPGTKIPNTAAIYFDFNAPIITNTIESTIETVVSIDGGLENSPIQLYPNPTRNRATVSFEVENNTEGNVSVFNLQGQQVYDSGVLNLNSGRNQHPFSTSGAAFSAGIYLVKVALGEQVFVKRLVVTN